MDRRNSSEDGRAVETWRGIDAKDARVIGLAVQKGVREDAAGKGLTGQSRESRCTQCDA